MFFSQLQQKENQLRDRVKADADLEAKYGDAWDRIAAVQAAKQRLANEYALVEAGQGFWSTLMDHARKIVRASDELPKPNEQRLREYADSNLPALQQELFSTAPIHQEFEEMKLALSLTRLRELLGTDHPVVKAALGNESPEQVAKKTIAGTKLTHVDERKRLYESGKTAVQASSDAAIVLARTIDPWARQIRERFEQQVEAVETRNAERIAAARFAVFGTSVYPDATFSLRLAFGVVQGWTENGQQVGPFTTMAGAFERHTGAPPFDLPASWLTAKSKINGSTPMNLVSTHDIIGGNSGSPMFDTQRQIVGLIFDGNIHSLGGDYAYDPRSNRAVSVHSSAILEALDKVYDARSLREELLENNQ
jgi:hypothetical protein